MFVRHQICAAIDFIILSNNAYGTYPSKQIEQHCCWKFTNTGERQSPFWLSPMEINFFLFSEDAYFILKFSNIVYSHKDRWICVKEVVPRTHTICSIRSSYTSGISNSLHVFLKNAFRQSHKDTSTERLPRSVLSAMKLNQNLRITHCNFSKFQKFQSAFLIFL